MNTNNHQKFKNDGIIIDSSINQELNANLSQNYQKHEFLTEVSKLEKIIKNEPSLNSEQKNEVSEAIKHIKKATQNSDSEQKKKYAKIAWEYLKGIPAGLKNANEIVEQLNKLLPYIQDIFGF